MYSVFLFKCFLFFAAVGQYDTMTITTSPVEESHRLQYDKLAPHKQWPWMSPKKDRVLKDQGTGKIVIPSSQHFLEEWTISSGRLLNDNSSQMSRADVPSYELLIRPLKNITLRKAMQSGKRF